MFKKGSKIYSILFNKCPQCNEGAFFKHSFSLNFKKITQIYDHCPKCNLRYMLEPSFYFGAMYVSYAISVALFVLIFIICKLLFKMSILNSFIAILGISFLLTPLNLRLSRIIWINIFVGYNKNAINKQSKK